MNDDTQTMYALLVGIDEYANPKIPRLGGCVNDVDAMERLLREQYGVPQQNIQKLTNHAASHQAIKDAFISHLINSARTWVAQHGAESLPSILFHYSGHGSQAVDMTGVEPDGMDETIVPHDSRTPGVYDIKDWELGQLLTELTAVTSNVVVILDCCHSGSGVRSISPGIAPARFCEPDLRPQPTSRPAIHATTRGAATASGWMRPERYVLLAGCRDRELANELVVTEGEQSCQHGAFSHFLIQELARINPRQRPTYRELHEQVRSLVSTRFRGQTPQCEGDRDREVFGGLSPLYDPLLTVVAQDAGLIWIDGGAAQGLTPGSELHVHPPGTRVVGAAQPIATLTVQVVGAVRSGCVVLDGSQEIPSFARVAMHRPWPGAAPWHVMLDISDEAIRHTLRARIAEPYVSDFVQEVSTGNLADFRIQLLGDSLHLQDSAGASLAAPYPVERGDEVVVGLTHIVRYLRALEFRNNARESALAGAVTLAIKQRVIDPVTQEPVARPFELTTGSELLVSVGEEIVIEITNGYCLPLYIGLFEFGYEWDIVQLYPSTKGAHEALAPGKTLAIGLRKGEEIVFDLPDNMTDVAETFKVIATLEEADFDIFTLAPLRSASRPLSRGIGNHDDSPVNFLLSLIMQAQPDRRALRVAHPAAKDEWTSNQVGLLITRRAQEVKEIAELLAP